MRNLTLAKKILSMLSLLWIMAAAFLAHWRKDQMPVINCNVFSGLSSCHCYNFLLLFYNFWLAYACPAIIMLASIWALNKSAHNITLFNNRQIRFSIVWCIFALIAAVLALTESYSIHSCVDPNIYISTSHWAISFQLFIILLIPLFIYWLIRWIIKGKKIFQ